MKYAIRLLFPASNNVDKYEALVNGLRITTELGVKRLEVQGGLQLVINQVVKESSYHDDKVAVYCSKVHKLEDKFYGLELHHVPRRLNEATDTLAKMAFVQEPVPLAGRLFV